MTAQFILGAIAGTCFGGLFYAFIDWAYQSFQKEKKYPKNLSASPEEIARIRAGLEKLNTPIPPKDPNPILPSVLPQLLKNAHSERITIPVKRCKDGRFKKRKKNVE